MKKKAIEAMPAIQATADGWCTTVQIIKDTIVLNIHQERELKWRHCFVPETKEYATYDAAWNTNVPMDTTKSGEIWMNDQSWRPVTRKQYMT